MKVDCILIGDVYAIDAGGKRFYFDLPSGCGVVAINQKGDQLKDPGPRSPFWRAAELWAEQGKRMTLDGVCVWTDKPTAKTIKIGPEDWWLVENVIWDQSTERYRVEPVEGS